MSILREIDIDCHCHGKDMENDVERAWIIACIACRVV